ncbi:FkbM family methyltransferase [Reyranella sp.]|uniref:FkbM family methyltransferase n=1 Tax=Reyranella sp. TaxID=1929291 RepID=UPI00273074B8|nr:FkbM family methyltransferase [Reyranella sp.]MDP2376435.1 FkbM family methyltransferase [Reyranella sp.]
MKVHELAGLRITQALVRAVYPFDSVQTVRRGPLKGYRVTVSPGMGYTYLWNLQGREWDWVRLVGKGASIYDIGANCGQSTLHLANTVGPGGTVVAFEPTPDNYQRLVRNIDLNDLGYVTPVCAAVSTADGVAQFQFDRHRPTMGRLSSANADMDNAEILEVRQIALDSYEKLGWPAPTFLKIDVEGGAAGVFGGGHELMKRCRPVVYIELHSLEEREAVRDLIARHDYRAFSVEGSPIEDPTAAYLTQLVCRPA